MAGIVLWQMKFSFVQTKLLLHGEGLVEGLKGGNMSKFRTNSRNGAIFVIQNQIYVDLDLEIFVNLSFYLYNEYNQLVFFLLWLPLFFYIFIGI